MMNQERGTQEEEAASEVFSSFPAFLIRKTPRLAQHQKCQA
jgi:hypothetical protein